MFSTLAKLASSMGSGGRNSASEQALGLSYGSLLATMALLALYAPSMQLHALSGVFNYPALTSVDVSGNRLRTLGAHAPPHPLSV